MDSEKICRTGSTALRWPCVFFDSWEVADDIGCARASRIVLFLCKACQRLIYRQQNEKNIFVDSSQPATTWFPHFFSCLVFTA